jgi:hypothetical protein
MDSGRTAELEFSLRHRHNDGTWSALERREAHDPSERDAERGWGTGTIYVCKTCDEQVSVDTARNPDPPGRPA